jgi:hypothetical protein
VSEGVWETLGIAETDDVAAVRSAYAQALKRIDMDADPRGYIALREARDHAIYLIRHAAFEAQQYADEEPTPPVAIDTLAAEPLAASSIEVADYESHVAELTRLLAPADDPATPITTDEALIRAHFEALLRDSRMEEVAFRAQAEAHLAQLIALNLPQSEMLVRPAMVAFKWSSPARIDTPPAVAAILDAAAGLEDGRPTATDQPVTTTMSADDDTPPPTDQSKDAQAQFFSDQYSALVALLFPQGENPPPLTPEENRTASGLFATLLCDPRMELVTFRVGAEGQFAQMLAYSIPRSDCILTRAIAFFGWQGTEGRIDQSDAVAHILHRERGLRFLHEVQAPDHPYRSAWIELTKPVGDKVRSVGSVHSGTVYNLLQSIRREQPLLERELNPTRVAMWDEKLTNFRPGTPSTGRSGGRRFPWWVFIIIVVVGGLSALGNLSRSVSNGFDDPVTNSAAGTDPLKTWFGDNGSPRPLLTDADSDIDAALARFGHADRISANDIKEQNPKLYAVLKQRWLDAQKSGSSRWSFSNDTFRFLSSQFGTLLPHAPKDELVAYWQIEIARLRMIADVMPTSCGAYVTGGPHPPLPPMMTADEDRLQALSARLLVEVPYDGASSAGSRRYVIPGEMVLKAAKTAGMTTDTFRTALGGKGTATAPCKARIGLIQAVIMTPGKSAEHLLREM